MKRRIYLLIKGVIIILCALCIWRADIQAVEAGLADNPYVTFSPDGNAFTTNAGDTNTQWYPEGTIVQTGKTSSLSTLAVGEHLYSTFKIDEVPVGKWEVFHEMGQCIHSAPYLEDYYYYGLTYGKEKCYNPYYSGWMAYCADCGQKMVNNFFYMSKEAAASLDTLDMDLAYYYLCPWCTNLEMCTELQYHICQAISANQYSVRYHANFGSGYMPKSVHMYNNIGLYEGMAVTPQKNLTLNSYTREGYEFIGWNTAIDGSGTNFRDGEEIYNLSTEEQGSVILYAQWKKSESELRIDPAGGSFQGSAAISVISGIYGSSYELETDGIEAPAGHTVHFDTNGGNVISDMTSTMEFYDWSFQTPINGSLQGNVYTFSGTDGSVDQATLLYREIPITLPEPTKNGYSFGGWYYDKEGTQIVGDAGISFLPAEDVTLYAYWVDLKLTSKDNYQVNDGKGAVDLTWKQPDGQEKYYLLYQKAEGDLSWKQIYEAEDITFSKQISKESIYCGEEGSYTIPYSGYYQVTIYGAQGESYGDYQGGKGGYVSAVIYFTKGEKLDFVVGGHNGYPNAGLGSEYGNGGGATSVSSDQKGLLLIAGGGGGASIAGNGEPGGSAGANTADENGQNGVAGGGGGYRGGVCGTVDLHTHRYACMHYHSGNETVCAGCYTVPVICGSTEFAEVVDREVFYYGNVDNDGNSMLCVKCDSYDCTGHTDYYYVFDCAGCGKNYNEEPESCSNISKFALGCNLEETTYCGYQEGQVLGWTPAYGGSNYINTAHCQTYEEAIGVKERQGWLKIESVQIGFVEENQLSGVSAIDFAKPEAISMDSVKITALGETQINVSFDRPKDLGTTYYHMVESYELASKEKLNVSNTTINTLTSGIKGYLYVLDEEPQTVVTASHEWYAQTGDNPYLSLVLSGQEQYLHIAAQDKAGNISETIHIPIATGALVHWPIVTEPMEIMQNYNIFPYPEASDPQIDYYVKADGVTPVYVFFQGLICGTASTDYQVNRLHYIVQDVTGGSEEGIYKVRVPMRQVITSKYYTYLVTEVQKQFENELCLSAIPFTIAKSGPFCKFASLAQGFTIPANLDGHVIRLTPQAGISEGELDIWSDPDADLENGMYLMADGRGPTVKGMDQFRDELNGETEYTVVLEAEDSGSGLLAFWVEIMNMDNGGLLKVEDTDYDGRIEVKVSAEEAVFSGEFIVQACAYDNVLNATTEVKGMDGIGLAANIEKVNETSTDTFKKGESGILNILAAGYVEKVEVLFPEEWCQKNPALNRTYTYEIPEYLEKAILEFMVPLEVEDGEYTITVKAYKDDKILEVNPELLIINVSGSVLDEIRTRLR